MTSLGEGSEWKDYSLGITKDEYDSIQNVINKQFFYNGWFTKENVCQSLSELGKQLTSDNLSIWTETIEFPSQPKRIAIIMAGNIPLVGFHDFLSVVISGNIAVCKLSSDDKTLLPALAECLIKFCPDIKSRIEFSLGLVKNMDAVIATGSDNSSKYFEQYFGKYPHVFRKNRTSVAVLNGEETKEDIHNLGKDIFTYFGLGCRNVTHLILPEGFELNRFFEGIVGYSEVVNHNKYANNYDYNKAVYLLNKHNLLDNNFVLLKESRELFSPLSMIHYHFYKELSEVEAYLNEYQEKIQVVVGKNYIPFGNAQCPTLNDYPDGVNILDWLKSLN